MAAITTLTNVPQLVQRHAREQQQHQHDAERRAAQIGQPTPLRRPQKKNDKECYVNFDIDAGHSGNVKRPPHDSSLCRRA
jgi:hypothetical protein